MSNGAIASLCFFMPIIFFSLVIYGLYYVHTNGIYEVRIPKICRCLWCKDYLTPEEKMEIRLAAALKKKIQK